MSQGLKILEYEPEYKTRIVPGFCDNGEAMKWRVTDEANKRVVAEGAVPVEASGTSIAWQKAASKAEAAVKLDRAGVRVKRQEKKSGNRKAVKASGDEAADNGRLALEG